MASWWAVLGNAADSAGKPNMVSFGDLYGPVGDALPQDGLLPIAYGRVTVRGALIGGCSPTGNNITDQVFLAAFCEGPIDSIQGLYFGAWVVDPSGVSDDSGPIISSVRWAGGAAGIADGHTWLGGAWFPESSYVYDRFRNTVVASIRCYGWASGGIMPWWQRLHWDQSWTVTISADVKGLKVYDPRGGGSTVWSDNPALIFRDLYKRKGKVLDAGFDDASIGAAATACESLGLTCNIVFAAKQQLSQALAEILLTCNGAETRVGGKIGLFIDQLNAGAAALTLRESDGSISEITYPQLSAAARPTHVVVKFPNAAARFVEDSVTAPRPEPDWTTTPFRETTYTIRGCTNKDQATILCDYLYNSAAITGRLSGRVGFEGILLYRGMKVHIITLAGVEADYLVEQPDEDAAGLYPSIFKPYDADVYGSTFLSQGPPVVVDQPTGIWTPPPNIPGDVTVTDSFPYVLPYSSSATETISRGYPKATYTLPADALFDFRLVIRSYVGSDAASKAWADMAASEIPVPLVGNLPPTDGTHFNLAALNTVLGNDTTGYDALGRITGEQVYFERWRLIIRVEGGNRVLSAGVTVDSPPIISVSSAPPPPPTPAHAVRYLDLDDVALGGLVADNAWQGIAYGASTYVAIAATGSGDRVMTSADGSTWVNRASAADLTWQNVAFGASLFVAVAWDAATNDVMTSPDGITWTLRAGAAMNHWTDICFGGGLFVAVSSDGTHQVMTSPDGITWTARTCPAGGWAAVAYGGSLFVAVASTGTNRVMTSLDGITWTARTPAEVNAWDAVAYGGGTFVAVCSTVGMGGTHQVMSSTDGTTWTARTAAASLDWNDVAYGGGVFVAVAQTGTGDRFMSSTDGATWASRTSPADSSWKAICYGGALFVVVAQLGTGYRVATSSAGTTWAGHTGTGGTAVEVAPPSTLRLISGDGGLRVSHSGGPFVKVGGESVDLGLHLETPSGVIDDSNTSFTHSTDLTGLAVLVIVDGIVDPDAAISGTSVTTSSAPHSSIRVLSAPSGVGTSGVSGDPRWTYGKACAAKEKNTTVAANSTKTLVNVSGRGVLTGLFLNSSRAGGGADTDIADKAVVNVYVDGEGSPSISFNIDDGFFHWYADAAGYAFPTIGLCQPSTSGSAGGYLYFPFPAHFSTSLKVDYVNPSVTNSAAIYSVIYYNLGGSYSFDRFSKLHVVPFSLSVAAYAEGVLADITGKGTVVGLHINIGCGSDWNPLEGYFRFYTDGEATASWMTSGTEDLFNNGNYFALGRFGTPTFGTAMLDTGGHRVGAYRYFVQDPMPFNFEGKFTWQNGVSGISRDVTGSRNITGLVWYLTES